MPVVFPYVPLVGAKKKVKWEVAEVKFGSGYHSATALGRQVMWDASFRVLSRTEKDEMVTTLLQAAGVDTLEWMPPGHATGQFVVDTWQVVPELVDGAYRIAMTLRLVEVESFADYLPPAG